MFGKCPSRIVVFSSAAANDTQKRTAPIAVIFIFIVCLQQWCSYKIDRYGRRPSEQRLLNCGCVLITQCDSSCVLALALYDLRAEPVHVYFLSGVVAKLRIKLHQCIRSILEILGRQILPVTPYFSTTHFEGLRITHVARLQDFRIKNSGCFQFLHVLEPSKFKRLLKNRRIRRRFADYGKQIPEMFGGRCSQGLVSDDREILSP